MAGRILHVTYDGLLEPLGASQVVPYVEALAADGFALDVLSFEKRADLVDHARRSATAARLAAAGVPWTARRWHARPVVPATAWDVATGTLAAVGQRPSVVHARGYVAASIGLAVRRATGAALLFDMRGFWVDERVEAGIWAPGAAVVRAARRLERLLLASADAVVVLTARAAAELKARTASRCAAPVHVVPTCVDLTRFRPAGDRARARAALGLRTGPVVVHAGTLASWYLAEATFAIGAAFARLTGGTFLVLTRDRARAAGLATRLAPEAVVHTAAPEDVPRWLAACDAGLAAVRPDPAKRASAPTKLAEYLACGLAVATTRGVGDLDVQLAGADVAVTFDADAEPGGVARRLAAAATRPDRVRAARGLAGRLFALERGTAAYGAIYRALGATPSAPARLAEGA
jgi:glycosyltransferase involved in cell wall biosynthesis